MMVLEGVTVLDLTRLMPGFSTLLLADLGADVIKIEEPTRGDYFREMGPKWGDDGYAFAMLNRNKRSLTLNLKSPKGVDLFRRLVAGADVVVESFRPGVMDRLGLGYEALQAANPGLICCAISGFGQTGPYRDIAGHDINYVALSGMASLAFGADGAPQIPAVPITDFESSQRAALAVVAALFQRTRSGHGQFIDIAMYEGAPAWLAQPLAEYFARQADPDPARYLRAGEDYWVGRVPGYGIYGTADGYLSLGAAEDKFWRKLCQTAGIEELIERRACPKVNPADVDQSLAAALEGRTRAEWVARLRAADVPCMPVYSLSEAVADPHVAARGLFTVTPGRGGEAMRTFANAFGLRAHDAPAPTPAPGLGEHTSSILASLDVTPAEFDRLRAERVV